MNAVRAGLRTSHDPRSTQLRRFESRRGHVTELQKRSTVGRSLIVNTSFTL